MPFFSKNTKRNTEKKYIFLENEGNIFQKRKKKRPFEKFKKIFAWKQKNLWKGIIIWIIGFWLIIALIAVAFLRVKYIYITRQDTISDINRAYESVEYVRWKSIFFLDSSEIVERIVKHQKNIKNISFSFSIPDTINISLSSYEVILQSGENLILENGSTVSQEGKEHRDIPSLSIVGQDDTPTFQYSQKELESIVYFLKNIPKNILWFDISWVLYLIDEKEFLIQTSNDTIFLLDLTQDWKKQMENLSIFFKEKAKITDPYIYVDARIPKKIYTCPLDQAYVCKKNLNFIYGENTINLLEEAPSLYPQEGLTEANLQSIDDQPNDK